MPAAASSRVVIGTVGALAATAAFAAWTVGGGGTGTATATSAPPLTTSVATTTAALYPGITGLEPVPQGEQPEPVPRRDHLGERERCRGAGRRSPDLHDHGRDVHDHRRHPDGRRPTARPTFTVPGVAMTNASDTGCQGATFTIPVTFTSASA